MGYLLLSLLFAAVQSKQITNMLQYKNHEISIVKMTFLLCLALVIMIAPSCNKSKGESQVEMYMTDAPGDYDAVLVDVRGVEMTGSGGGTVMLDAVPGIYNLLELSNGVSTLIANGGMEAGTISQIRLILGTNNSVMVDSVSYPLSTPSADQSGLKLLVNKTFQPGITYKITLDFDANQSIVQTGNGAYKLKPVIRTIDLSLNGSIKGTITPIGMIASVTATYNGISYSSATNANGQFLIAGLPAGTYDITITPPFPYLPVTLTGKSVTIGNSTDVGLVAL